MPLQVNKTISCRGLKCCRMVCTILILLLVSPHLTLAFMTRIYAQRPKLIVVGFSWTLRLFISCSSNLLRGRPFLYFWMKKPTLANRWQNELGFWSFDENGKQVVTTSELCALDFHCSSKISRQPLYLYQPDYLAIHQFHHLCGIDDSRNEAARLLGYPLVEFIPCENGKYMIHLVNIVTHLLLQSCLEMTGYHNWPSPIILISICFYVHK